MNFHVVDVWSKITYRDENREESKFVPQYINFDNVNKIVKDPSKDDFFAVTLQGETNQTLIKIDQEKLNDILKVKVFMAVPKEKELKSGPLKKRVVK